MHKLYMWKLSLMLFETTIIALMVIYPTSKPLAMLSLVGFSVFGFLSYRDLHASKRARFCFGILFVIGIIVIASPLLPLHPPGKIMFPFYAQLQAPAPDFITQRHEDHTFWLGVDQQGRDLLSRIIWGTRQLYFYVILSTVATYGIGILAGLLAGYFQGWLNRAVQFVARILLNIPTLVLYIVLLTTLEFSLWVLILAITLATAPRVMKLVQRSTHFLSERGFVLAAHMRGESHGYTIFQEIFPNLRKQIAIDMLQRMSYIFATVATLGYLGFSPADSYDDLGRMLRESVVFAQSTPYIAVIPVIILVSITLSLNVMATGLRKNFDSEAGYKHV